MSENEIDYEGVKLVAVEQEGCDGCFFRNLSCGHIETPCSSSRRQDGRPVIWVLKGELLGATDKALAPHPPGKLEGITTSLWGLSRGMWWTKDEG